MTHSHYPTPVAIHAATHGNSVAATAKRAALVAQGNAFSAALYLSVSWIARKSGDRAHQWNYVLLSRYCQTLAIAAHRTLGS